MGKIKDYIAISIFTTTTILFLLPLLFLFLEIIINGVRVIYEYGLYFFVDRPPLPGNGLGGIGTVLQGSLYMVSLALLIAAPISIFTGIFLTFFEKYRISKIIRYSLELIVEFPTIIIGIIVFSIFVLGFSIAGFSFKIGLNGISGAIALAIVMLPYATIQVNESLRIPRKLYEESAYSLGLTTWQVMKVVFSAGKKGVLTGILIGFAKIIGETAPIIFVTTTTANLYLASPTTPVTGIPVLIYTYAFSPFQNWHDVAWGAAFTLLMLVLAVFIISRIFTKEKK